MKDQCKRTTISTIAAYLFVGSLICGIAPTVRAVAPSIDTRWDDTTLDEKALLGAAERAIKAGVSRKAFKSADKVFTRRAVITVLESAASRQSRLCFSRLPDPISKNVND